MLGRNADIEMRSEDLAISEKEIAVRYRFFNRGPKDETVTVAFPMPDIVGRGPDVDYAVPSANSRNFLDFRTLVDGAELTTDYEEKAVAGAIDVSGGLRALGVPLAVQSEETYNALDRLPRAEQDGLVKAGLAGVNEFDVGKGMERHLISAWTFESAFFWSQTFPAGREVAIEHRYSPSVGSTTGASLELTPIEPTTLAEYQRRYCVDRDFLMGLRRAQAKASAGRGRPISRSASPMFSRPAPTGPARSAISI